MSTVKATVQQNFTVPAPAPLLEIRTTLDSDLPYAKHFHSSFSFGLILAGRTCFSLGTEKYEAESGDIVLIAPEQVHSCNPVAGTSRSYQMVHVDAGWFHEHLGTILYQRSGVGVAVPCIRDAELFSEARHFLANACTQASATGVYLTSLLTKMHTRYHSFRPAVITPEKYPAPLTERCMQERIMDGEYSVSELAEGSGLRRESFSRSFHRATGLPPSHYLHCLRLEYGRHLLQEGHSIADAAIASGYVDQSHFHRMFVKYCSVTPGCYRKNQSHPYKK